MSLSAKTVGIAGFTLQLRKLTLYYCKTGGSSRGMRDFLNASIVNWAKDNPSVVFDVKLRTGGHPYLKAEYLNGYQKTIGVKNLPAEGVESQVKFLHGSLGSSKPKLHNRQISAHPSIQGTWHPFLNQHAFAPLEAVGRRELMKVKARTPTSVQPPPDPFALATLLGVGTEYNKAANEVLKEGFKKRDEHLALEKKRAATPPATPTAIRKVGLLSDPAFAPEVQVAPAAKGGKAGGDAAKGGAAKGKK